jgi:ferredoxin
VDFSGWSVRRRGKEMDAHSGETHNKDRPLHCVSISLHIFFRHISFLGHEIWSLLREGGLNKVLTLLIPVAESVHFMIESSSKPCNRQTILPPGYLGSEHTMMRRQILRPIVLVCYCVFSLLDHPSSTDAFLSFHTDRLWTASCFHRPLNNLSTTMYPTSFVKRKRSTRSSQSGDSGVAPTPSSYYTIQVWYEGQSCDVQVMENETILSALERNLVSDKLGLPNHMIPYDCRKGSCLTCTGAHATEGSVLAAQNGSLVMDKKYDDKNNNKDSGSSSDGLSPYMSELLRSRGYVLTCSAKVAGEGLQLVLGEHNTVWKELYQHRLEDDTARKVGWAAMALTKRKSDERNVPRWTKQTEAVLEETSSTTGGIVGDDIIII